jgi:hypothetical protein
MTLTKPIIQTHHILIGLALALVAVSVGLVQEMGVLFLIAVAVLPFVLVSLYTREQYIRHCQHNVSQYVLLKKQKVLRRGH